MSGRPTIRPHLWFDTEARCGTRLRAIATWCTFALPGSRSWPSRPGPLARYPAGMAPDCEGTVMYMDFRLGDTWFAAMDSARGRGVRLVQGPLRRVLAGGAGRDAGADAQ
jgi:predicted 3-demethylubiquinone-9 3-methyltransferase (glyoxalase superfamily)